jgi:large subunit ribosomal protein L2
MNKLAFRINSKVGRSQGRIVSFHRSKGSKKLYKFVDFSRSLVDVIGKVLHIQKAPYRTGYIGLIGYSNGYMGYILANEGLREGDLILNSLHDVFDPLYKEKLPILGNISCYLRYLPIGKQVYNLEDYPGRGGRYSRSAGTFSLIRKKFKSYCLVQVSSGELRRFSLDCIGTLGRVSNSKHRELGFRKAGVKRWLGKRPIVRGRAMNPVDHPHGGRTNGGITPKTAWGKIAKGIKTSRRVGIILRKGRR